MTKSLGSPSGAQPQAGALWASWIRLSHLLGAQALWPSPPIHQEIQNGNIKVRWSEIFLEASQLTMFKIYSERKSNLDFLWWRDREERNCIYTRSWIIAHPPNFGWKKKRKRDERLKFFCCQPCQSVASHPSRRGAGVATTGILQPIFTSHLKPILTNPNPWIFFSFTSRWFRVSCLLRIF